MIFGMENGKFWGISAGKQEYEKKEDFWWKREFFLRCGGVLGRFLRIKVDFFRSFRGFVRGKIGVF